MFSGGIAGPEADKGPSRVAAAGFRFSPCAAEAHGTGVSRAVHANPPAGNCVRRFLPVDYISLVYGNCADYFLKPISLRITPNSRESPGTENVLSITRETVAVEDARARAGASSV